MEEQDTSVSTPAQEASPPSLSVPDLLLMLQIIQVVAQRGAFRADEMTNIGGLHDRLAAFLTHAGVLKKSSATNEEAKEGDQQ